MRTDRAARDIRKKKTEYISDAAQRQKIGQIEDAQQTAEYQDVLQQGRTSRPATASCERRGSSPSAQLTPTSSSALSQRSSRPRFKRRARPGASGGNRLKASPLRPFLSADRSDRAWR
jgi:hypothetical protein